MDSTRWERIQAVFHEALERPEAERQTFLEAACADDPEMTATVLAMIEKDRRASILDRDLPQLAQQFLDGSREPGPLQEFGPYRIQKKLGEGGMGVVYLAERTDLGNLVAIKFVRGAGLSPARGERFASEQRTLAPLNHPYIARLYDAGTLEDGTPWFAMEYVEGEPLNEYWRASSPIKERLRLLGFICEAVRYAHDREIVHRDLKPSNILVRTDGTPRLLDFGIAKQLENPDRPAERSRTGLSFLTPAYAAPEQIRGEPVGTYTDVYSLGVILYEMLTGRLPFDFSAGAFAKGNKSGEELENLISQAPEKPSMVARRKPGSSRLSKANWDDLDALCLKAMHRNVQDRYSSVDALIQDVNRFLKGEPLVAGPDTRRYRVDRFLRRNKTAALATCLVLATMAGLVTFYTLRVTKERNRAQAEAARSQRVEEFMENLFQGGDDEAGPPEDLRVVTLLDKGLKDTQALTTDPKVQADLYQTLGTVYESLGQLDRADSLLRSALELHKSVFGPDHEEVADTLLKTGVLRLDQGQAAESERLIREALAMDKRRLRSDDPAVVEATILLGRVLEQRGAYDQAIQTLNDAKRLVSGKDASKKEFSACLTLLANAYFYLGDYPRADSLNRQALETDRRLYGDHHPDLADDLINLGQLQTQWGHYPEAEKYFRQALEINSVWFGQDNPQTADVATYVAQSLEFQGREAEAEAILKQSLAALETVYKKPNPRVALTLGELGSVARDLGNLDGAEADFKREADIYQLVYGDDHRDTCIALSNLASIYSLKKQFARAEALFRDVVQRYGRILPADHLNVGITRIGLGDALTAEKRYPDAESELLAGYRILTKQTSPQVSWLKTARVDLALVYDALKQPEKAATFRAELKASGAKAESPQKK